MSPIAGCGCIRVRALGSKVTKSVISRLFDHIVGSQKQATRHATHMIDPNYFLLTPGPAAGIDPSMTSWSLVRRIVRARAPGSARAWGMRMH